jgi:hypothetical protein
MTWAQLTEVWTPLSTIANFLGGLLFGLLGVGWAAVNPAYSARLALPREVALITFLMTASGGLVFYGIQTATSVIGEDPAWTRVVSRFGIWVLFAVAIGAGAWIRLRWDLWRRHAKAHTQAVAELRQRDDDA